VCVCVCSCFVRQYLRTEETGVGSAALENALSTLHESIIGSCPSLLPAFRRVTNEIHNDRTRMLQQRAELLGALTVVKPAGSFSHSNKPQDVREGGGGRGSTHAHNNHNHSNVTFHSDSFAGGGVSMMSMVSNDRSGEMRRARKSGGGGSQSIVDMTSGGIYSSRSSSAGRYVEKR
jgi:hypothetical protein